MGKFYDMINDFHESSKKWDPITHYTLDLTHDASTKTVGETSHGIGKLFGDNFIGRGGKHWDQMADKDKADFGRWGGNTLGAAAAIYGGMSAAGGSGASSLGSGAGSGGWMTGGGGSAAASGGGDTAAGTMASGMGEGGWLSGLLGSGQSGGSGGGTGGQSGGGYAFSPQSQQPGQQPGLTGNPALSEALARLVSEQEQTKRVQMSPFTASMNAPGYQPTSYQQFMQMIQPEENYGGEYGWSV